VLKVNGDPRAYEMVTRLSSDRRVADGGGAGGADLTRRWSRSTWQGRIGVVAPPPRRRSGNIRWERGGGELRELANVDLVFTTLGKLFTRELSLRTMSGPIDIYKISGQTFREGWNHFLQFMALVSLQLGVINLMPFPVLDGGHIFILLLEGLVRRDLSLKIKERLMQVGFYLLLLLMGTIIYLDIAKNSNNFERIRNLFP
jgi:membrane-associated protease RseP (regulator of RpoE activity)